MTAASLNIVNAMLSLLLALHNTPADMPVSREAQAAIVQALNRPLEQPIENQAVRSVPFFSQFKDITSPVWQKRGCGIASLGMLIEYYKPGVVSLDTLLHEGIDSDSYIQNVGWIHSNLAAMAEKYGLRGASYDLTYESASSAFAQMLQSLEDGPVIASVHYTFDPKNIIPHLVVITGTDGENLFYNDPTLESGGNAISKDTFIRSWKKRYIEVRPI